MTSNVYAEQRAELQRVNFSCFCLFRISHSQSLMSSVLFTNLNYNERIEHHVTHVRHHRPKHNV